jgi:hypothetical protein
MPRSSQQVLARVLIVMLWVLSLLALATLLGSVLMEAYTRISSPLQGLAFLLLHGAGLIVPIAVLLIVLLAAASFILFAQPSLRSCPLALGCALAVATLFGIWHRGVPLPQTRTGEFSGRYILNPLCCRSDIFVPNQDPNDPLSRGAELGAPFDQDVPILAAVRVPKHGWYGSHPSQWPATYSDSHGAQSFCILVRGRLTGPGQYGWPPVLQYRLSIDSVIGTAPRLSGEDLDCSEPL